MLGKSLIMREYFIPSASMAELLHNLSKDVRTFFRQEIQLAKTEMSEKVSKLARDAMILGVGNLMAGAGSILLLASLGFLLAFAFQASGMNALLAMFLGFLIVGFLVVAIGAVISIKGIKALSKDSLAPQRTIHTVSGVESESQSSSGKEPSAAELHIEALATKRRIGEERRELTHRISALNLKKVAVEQVRKHPVSVSSAALACALTGIYFIGRKLWRA
ncbi:MAG TPA: phage holin family protein [Verrucomicrobiae bacterium]|jgi:hypothetical protein|nr:phage holin family protein [Verrucomicrobiae bacterium]